MSPKAFGRAFALLLVGVLPSSLAVGNDLLWGHFGKTYCTDFAHIELEWSVCIPSQEGFTIGIVDGYLRFEGRASRPAFAPQIVLHEDLHPSLTEGLEAVALVDIEELGAVFALDVDDVAGRYNWTLDVSGNDLSFGFEDSKEPHRSQQESPNRGTWEEDDALGQHRLRIVFTTEHVTAYFDSIEVGSFAIPDNLSRGVLRLSVGPLHPPDGDARRVDYSRVRVLNLCFGEVRVEE